MKIVQRLLTLLAFASIHAVVASPIPVEAEGKRDVSTAVAEAVPQAYSDYGQYGTYQDYPPPPPAPTNYGSYSGYGTYKRDAKAEPADMIEDREAVPEAVPQAVPQAYSDYGTYGTYTDYPPPPPAPTNYGSYSGYGIYKRIFGKK